MAVKNLIKNSTCGSVTPAPVKCPLFRLPEAAKYLDVSESLLKQNPDLVPFIRIGQKLKRYLKTDLDKFLERNREVVK